jgi:hypothetical protein
VEPDFDLAVLAVEAGERVAVGDRDDPEMLGQRGAGQDQQEQGGGGECGAVHESRLIEVLWKLDSWVGSQDCQCFGRNGLKSHEVHKAISANQSSGSFIRDGCYAGQTQLAILLGEGDRHLRREFYEAVQIDDIAAMPCQRFGRCWLDFNHAIEVQFPRVTGESDCRLRRYVPETVEM